MSKRSLYILIAFILVIGVYGFEFVLDSQEEQLQIEKGETLKSETNDFLLPTSTTGQVVHHDSYSLSYSEPYEQAEWVAYELKLSHLKNTQYKRPYFEIDHAIRTGAASWKNYKNSGYDRGHLCPAGDRSYSQEAYNETFLTSNISPQSHNFNSGIWNSLEQKTRQWAKIYNGVYVVTGGVLQPNLPTIGSEKVAVPNYFYKIILNKNGDTVKMIGFLMLHQNSKRPLEDFVVSVDSIEQLTGIDFFPKLDDQLEHDLEAGVDYSQWQFN